MHELARDTHTHTRFASLQSVRLAVSFAVIVCRSTRDEEEMMQSNAKRDTHCSSCCCSILLFSGVQGRLLTRATRSS